MEFTDLGPLATKTEQCKPSLQNNKTPGPDGIAEQVLKLLVIHYRISLETSNTCKVKCKFYST